VGNTQASIANVMASMCTNPLLHESS